MSNLYTWRPASSTPTAKPASSDQPHTHQQQKHHIPDRESHLPIAGPPLTSTVAATGHGYRRVVGAPETEDKQRHHQWNQDMDPFPGIPRAEVSTTSPLGLKQLFQLTQESGNEPQRDGHHQGNLCARHADSPKRGQQPFDTIGDGDRRSGEGEHGATHQEEGQPQGEESPLG